MLKNFFNAPLNLLVHQDSARVITSLTEGYYGDFLRFLTNPAKRDLYRANLLHKEVIDNTRLRAKAIELAGRLSITYDEACCLSSLSDWMPTDEEAAELVMNNYRAMLETPVEHNIFVKVDQFGRIVVAEGLHRTVIAYARGAKTIPAKILSRHPEWLDFINFFRTEGEKYYGSASSTYQKISHPDFADYSVIREDRSGSILRFLKERKVGLSGLDIGSLVGFYSHTLGCAGYKMQAVEYEEKYASAFSRLATLYNSGAEVWKGDIYDMDIPPARYDFAVALSIIYHLIRNDESKCIRLIDDLKKKIPLFFIDTEVRTELLSEGRLRSLFQGYQFTSIYIGNDDRQIFAIERPADA